VNGKPCGFRELLLSQRELVCLANHELQTFGLRYGCILYEQFKER
jgi:hypothetical protein